jgi:hypothetical protein
MSESGPNSIIAVMSAACRFSNAAEVQQTDIMPRCGRHGMGAAHEIDQGHRIGRFLIAAPRQDAAMP